MLILFLSTFEREKRERVERWIKLPCYFGICLTIRGSAFFFCFIPSHHHIWHFCCRLFLLRPTFGFSFTIFNVQQSRWSFFSCLYHFILHILIQWVKLEDKIKTKHFLCNFGSICIHFAFFSLYYNPIFQAISPFSVTPCLYYLFTIIIK